MTAEELTDDDIAWLENLAIETEDLPFVLLCRISYRYGGIAKPHARARVRVAAAITELRAFAAREGLLHR